MKEYPISSIMDNVMSGIKEMVDVNTIIGEPITAGNEVTLIPISKVTFGFASGGTDFDSKRHEDHHFGGGTGAGVTIQPVGFIVIHKDEVRMMEITTNPTSTDKAITVMPDLIDKVISLFKKSESKKEKDIDGPICE